MASLVVAAVVAAVAAGSWPMQLFCSRAGRLVKYEHFIVQGGGKAKDCIIRTD